MKGDQIMTTNRITLKQKDALVAISLYGDVAGKHETIAEATYTSLKARGLIIIDRDSIRVTAAGRRAVSDATVIEALAVGSAK